MNKLFETSFRSFDSKAVELSEVKPGGRISFIGRILSNPKKPLVSSRNAVGAIIGDSENLIHVVAFDRDTKKLDLKKGEIVRITNGIFSGLKNMKQPPTITLDSRTLVEKVDVNLPSIEECMKKKFIDELNENEYCAISGFPIVYRIFSYYCNRCKKFTEEMCDCGNFPEPIFRISGVLSDGTKTVWFSTSSEETAEDLSGIEKSNAVNTDIKSIMAKPHKFLGYLHEGNFYVEEILE